MPEEKLSWKDTNLALIGSEIDRKVKAAAAEIETAWDGVGQEEGIRVWRIENFQVKEWPQDQYGEFFRGDSYIVLKSYRTKNSNALKHDVHIWIGSESTQGEYGTAAYKMVELDTFLGGIPVQHRQVEGKESLEFSRYFETLEYLDGGVASGFRKVEPTIEKPLFFCVKGTHAKTLKMMQVPLSITSMNEGDSFILCASKDKVWCWHGKEARPIEKASSNAWAEKLCTLGTVTTLDQGHGDEEDKEFWEYLGKGTIAPAVPDDAEVCQFTPVLYRVDGDAMKPLEKVAYGTLVEKAGADKKCLKKDALDDSDVFLLDAGWEIFVWIGKGADVHEKIAAMGAADRYAEMEPRANFCPVTILKSGQETSTFLSFFD
ncbi:gelosin/severin like protein [Nitzschia inconspicua]|uniref:Gelosin/severin like protein n=1 Tax=Nitzschia inconspicua TaxID=303405 RepID=A0A9K3PDQ2_9STRA|nr:gelosin/severin like protein [Nitzschia inconspicua]